MTAQMNDFTLLLSNFSEKDYLSRHIFWHSYNTEMNNEKESRDTNPLPVTFFAILA